MLQRRHHSVGWRDHPRQLAALVRWWRGDGALPTTLAGVEMYLVFMVVVIRTTNVVQLGVGAVPGISFATRPVLDFCLMVAYLAESVWLLAMLMRLRSLLHPHIAAVDVAMAAVATLGQLWFTTDADRVGTWTGWGFGISMAAAFIAGVGFPRRRQTAIAVLVLVVAYSAASLPSVASGGGLTTVVSNTLGLAATGFFSRALGGYLRRLGRDADVARAEAARAAEESMLRRQRDLLHDQETVLRMLANPGTDSSLTVLLRDQATTAANQIRQFLTGPRDLSRDGGLVATVNRAAAPFSDLVIVYSLDLAASVRLGPGLAGTVHSAVTTLLHNIRRHAAAQEVVLHADTDGSSTWELTVRDDGVGFDHAWSTAGYGLTHQVRDAIGLFGGTVEIDTAPHRGTCVTIRCPIQATA